MSRSKAYVVLAALLAAGCASTPRGCRRGGRRGTGSRRDASRSSAPKLSFLTPSSTRTSSSRRTPPPPICREVLKPNSNVHETAMHERRALEDGGSQPRRGTQRSSSE